MVFRRGLSKPLSGKSDLLYPSRHAAERRVVADQLACPGSGFFIDSRWLVQLIWEAGSE